MISDCHTHINGQNRNCDMHTHAEAYMDIDVCFVLSNDLEDRIEQNLKVAQYAAENPGKVYGFMAFDPMNDKVAVNSVTSSVINAGFAGAVMYCSCQGFHPTDSRAMGFYAAAEELGFPVFFHNRAMTRESILDYSQPYLLDEVARSFPNLKIVIGDMGLPFINQTIAMVVKHQNVYADLTISPHRIWEVYNVVVRADEANIMDKLFFGSGFPVAEPNECIETLLGFNRLFADTNLPSVPREHIRNIIERDIVKELGIKSTCQ
jgi:uncharacterized protein